MSRKIQDELTDVKMSRQRKWQLRRREQCLCEACGEPAIKGCHRCVECLGKARERARKRLGCKRRYQNAESYQLEKDGED